MNRLPLRALRNILQRYNQTVSAVRKILFHYLIIRKLGRSLGIPEEKRSNLFKPFAEVQDLTKGDGLGLPTCALMAYKLNGTLRLDEEYKKGTRFVLELHS